MTTATLLSLPTGSDGTSGPAAMYSPSSAWIGTTVTVTTSGLPSGGRIFVETASPAGDFNTAGDAAAVATATANGNVTFTPSTATAGIRARYVGPRLTAPLTVTASW